ncbi:hypothetical protein HanXRQr2_Chr08g0327081 [Helianthus annuus]|uniref:Uncharacterized protein n=1 Tax=Helianthus annuus TaxID=4232 RepID=A0A9K3NBH4_HELAN|nr:hypothetical protein HanXRQr2_Chr08g0327081 [Helianthus annuus]
MILQWSVSDPNLPFRKKKKKKKKKEKQKLGSSTTFVFVQVVEKVIGDCGGCVKVSRMTGK